MPGPSTTTTVVETASAPDLARGSCADWIRREALGIGSAAVAALTQRILEIHGEAVQAIVFYGSSLREKKEGLLDLMVVVDRYRAAYRGWRLPLLNRLLAPNVFYLEATAGGETVRSKYAVVRSDRLQRLVSTRGFQSYFWGRLAQPSAIVHVRDPAVEAAVVDVLATAVRTFMSSAAMLVPPRHAAEELWSRGLEACYRTEFRAERKGVAERILGASRTRFEAITAAAAPELGWSMLVDPSDGRRWFEPGLSPFRRWLGRRAWGLRRWQGRFLQVLRLAKAVWTFTGGLDYILWKIERHSGVRVEVSERARRHPLLASWPTLWRIYRRGGFR